VVLIALTIVITALVAFAAAWLAVWLLPASLLARLMPGSAIDHNALSESEEHLALAQRAARIGWWEHDWGAERLRWSDEQFRLLGYEPGEVVPSMSAFLDRVHPDDRERITNLAKRSWDSEEPSISRYRLLLPDGSEQFMQTTSSVTRSSDGTPVKKVGVHHDITERQSSDEALRDSEERFRVIFETAPNGIALLDGAGDAMMVNDAICEMLDYTRAELMGMSLAQVIAEEDRELAFSRLAARASGEQVSVRSTVRLLRKDGTRIDTDVFASPYEIDGERLGSVLEIRDVTEKMALQRRSADVAAEIATILETAPDPIVRIDADGMILRVNPTVSAIFGWEPDELTGLNISVLVGGAAHADHASYMAHFAATGEASTGHGLVVGRTTEAIGRRRDGAEFPIEISVAEVNTAEGEPMEFTGILRDVSERFAAQQALEESEERFRTAFEASQNGMLLLSHDGDTLLQNAALRGMLGFDSAAGGAFAAEHGRPPELGDCLSEDDLKRFIDLLPTPPGGPYAHQHFRVALRSLGGAIVQAEVTASEFSQGGGSVGNLVEIRDITDQLAVERSLRDSEEHLQAVVDTVRSGLVIRDRDERVLWFNQAVCDLFGCTPEEFRTLPLSALISSDDLPFASDNIHGASSGRGAATGWTFCGRRRDGAEIAVRVNATPFTQDGEVVGMLAELSDVTEEMRLREQLLTVAKAGGGGDDGRRRLP
jgi:PAS domain S-box-containing protein